MRKLTILALIFTFVSAANATVLTWSVDAITMSAIGGTAVVQLIDDDGITHASPKWVGYSPATVNPIATISAITALAAAGGNAEIRNPSQTGYVGWWTVMSMDTSSPFTVASGAQYNVTISALREGTYAISSDLYGTNDILLYIIIPEPTTVALLGLGGLLMLRRRK